jgi:hypothetical protein
MLPAGTIAMVGAGMAVEAVLSVVAVVAVRSV